MAMGFDMLSMSSTNLPKVKSVIRGISLKFAQDLLAEVMAMSNADLIRERVERALSDADVARLIRPIGSDDLEE
jgi:phosphotransferase system enzyme I (PtsP)